MKLKAKIALLLMVFLICGGRAVNVYAQGQCSWHLNKSAATPDFSSKESFRRGYQAIRSVEQASDYIKKALNANRITQPNFKSEVLRFEKAMIPYLDRFSVSLLINFLEILVRAKVVHLETATLETINLTLSQKIPETKIKRLPQLLKSFEDLMTRPSESVLKQIELKFTSEIERLNENNLYWILKSFARLDYKPSSQFLQAWFKQVEAKVSSLNEGHLSGILFSFYLMQSWESVERFVSLVPSSTWQTMAQQGTKINNSQISLASMYLELVLNRPNTNLKAFRQYFTENVIEPNSGSWLEFEVQMYLTSLNLKYIQEYKTKPGFYVDFFIPEQNRIIQVDGNQHYIKSLNSKTSEVIHRQRPQDTNIDEMLKASGYIVERLDIESVKNL